MPKQLLFALLIESALITATTLLLTQPRAVFAAQSERFRQASTAGGLMLLCFTFVWSVVFGALITLHSFTLRI